MGRTPRDKIPTHYRRVITGFAGSKSVVRKDELLKPYQFKSIPGYEHTLVWLNAGVPELGGEPKPGDASKTILPGPGGSSMHFVTFPPFDPSIDQKAAAEESLKRLPGLADTFEEDAMHKTQSVDYAIVFEGEMWLELDDKETIHLKRGDVVIQNGTRHAWRNKGSERATMLFIIMGANKR